MNIKVPHPFSNHDNRFNVQINGKFYFLPFYNKSRDEDIWMEYKDTVFYNYFTWLWFAVSWMSSR